LFYYKQKGDGNYCHHLFLPWFYRSEEGDDSKLASPFSVVVSQRRRRRQQLSSPFSMGLLQKMATITIVTFLWFCYEEGDGNNVVAFFYGDGVMKKVMATCSLLFSFSLVFGSSLLELTINNEMVVFLLC